MSFIESYEFSCFSSIFVTNNTIQEYLIKWSYAIHSEGNTNSRLWIIEVKATNEMGSIFKVKVIRFDPLTPVKTTALLLAVE